MAKSHCENCREQPKYDRLTNVMDDLRSQALIVLSTNAKRATLDKEGLSREKMREEFAQLAECWVDELQDDDIRMLAAYYDACEIQL